MDFFCPLEPSSDTWSAGEQTRSQDAPAAQDTPPPNAIPLAGRNWPTIGENLAFDEVLLAQAELGAEPASELLRVWRPATYAVIVGRGSRLAGEVNLGFCQSAGIPVYRRISGGAAVVLGPGCWAYSVLLDLRRRPELRDLNRTHRYVMERIQTSVQALVLGHEIRVQGICDLTVGGQKCSGNSLRVTRDHVLYHGTLLVEFDLSLVERCLGTPPRQPEYRQQRPHGTFVTNVPWDRLHFDLRTLWEQWCRSIQHAWGASPGTGTERPSSQIVQETRRLAREKYESPEWIASR